MLLEALLEHASRRLAKGNSRNERAAKLANGLSLLQRDVVSSFETSVYEPALCLILQGRKQVSIGDHTLQFGPGECLLVSHDVPVRSRIAKAPYLALIFSIDIATIQALCDELAGTPRQGELARAVSTHRAESALLDALGRYLTLADTPAEARVLGPLVAKEIHYRVLMAPFGGMLRSLINQDSHATAITRAIGHIRGDLRTPFTVPNLARRVGMSASAFHKSFKTVTATTPLQYQKELRLLEARRLLQSGSTSVTVAAFEVGYESSSQFSREYARKFGVPPSQDLRRGE